jgi:uncharacterized protein with HEPN domain
MNADDRWRLQHMLDAAREAISFIDGRTSEDLTRDRMLLLALVKEIEIAGEAATNISPDCRNNASGIPWAKVTGMRNRLTRGYFSWDLDVIWATLTTNLPDLISELRKTLELSEEES